MPISRRQMVQWGVLASLGAIVAACGPNANSGSSSAGSQSQAAAPTAASTTSQPTAAPASAAAAKPTTAAASAAQPTVAASQGASTPAPAAQASAGSGQAVTLPIINHDAYGPELDKLVFPPAYQIFQKQTGITVNETILPEDQNYPVKLLTMVASGSAPDAAFVHPQWVPSLAFRGALIEIDSYMKDPEVKASDLLKGALTYYQFPQGAKTYGIPHYSGPCVTIFNRTLYKQAGIPAPDEVAKTSDGWTWQAALETAQKMTKGSGPTKQFGWDSLTSGLHFLDVLIWGFGGDLWDEAMSHCLLGDPKPLEALQFYADFLAKYHVTPTAAEAAGVTHSKSGRMISGRIAAQYGIKGNVPEIAAWSEKENIEMGMTAIPKGTAGRFVRNGPNSFCMIKGCKHPDESFKLINFMSLDDFQNLQYKVGASIPPRQSQLASDAFKKSLRPWESLAVWQEAAKLDHPLREAATHLDIQNTFNPAWDLITLGQKTAKEAIPPIIPKIDALLAQAKNAS